MMDDTMPTPDESILNRLVAVTKYAPHSTEALRELCILCVDECHFNYQGINAQTIERDELLIFQWLRRIDEWLRTTQRDWPVQSWVFGLHLIPEDQGKTLVSLEIEGYEFRDWDESLVDDVMYQPDDASMTVQSVNAAYETATALDETTRMCVEYVLCLGLAAILVRHAILQKPGEVFEGKAIYVCWGGGDHIAVTP
jgi:hypothetical protein